MNDSRRSRCNELAPEEVTSTVRALFEAATLARAAAGEALGLELRAGVASGPIVVGRDRTGHGGSSRRDGRRNSRSSGSGNRTKTEAMRLG